MRVNYRKTVEADADREARLTKQREMRAAAKEAAAASAAEEEPVAAAPEGEELITPKEDTAAESRKAGHKAGAKALSRVEPGGYKLPSPGSGTAESYGDNFTQAPQGGGASSGMSMDASMFSGGGGEGGGGGGGAGGAGGGGGGGMMGGLPTQIGQDTASIDDEVNAATETMFQDETVRDAHQAAMDEQRTGGSSGKAANIIRKRRV